MRTAQQAPPRARRGDEAEKARGISFLQSAGGLLPRPVFWFALLYFCGYGVGLALGRLAMPEFGGSFAKFYLDKQNFLSFGGVFASLFTAALLQLTFLAVSGFCAIGMGLLVSFFALKGALMGICTAALYTAGGAKGLVIYWLLTWLPEISLLLLTLFQAGCSAGVCGGIFRFALCGNAPRLGMNAPVRRCLKSYIITSFLSVLFSALGAGAALFFAAVLL